MGTHTYSDLDFELTIDPDGNLKTVTDGASIQQSIETILTTIPSERVNLPQFGSRFKQLLFQPIDEFTAIDIEDEVEVAINTWEDRVTIKDVVITPYHNKNAYKIEVYCFILATKLSTTINLNVKVFG